MIPIVVQVTGCKECPFSNCDDHLETLLLAIGGDGSAAWLCTQGGECTTEGAPPVDCPLRSSSIVVTLAEDV